MVGSGPAWPNWPYRHRQSRIEAIDKGLRRKENARIFRDEQGRRLGQPYSVVDFPTTTSGEALLSTTVVEPAMIKSKNRWNDQPGNASPSRVTRS
jgi:hypothetical protein